MPAGARIVGKIIQCLLHKRSSSSTGGWSTRSTDTCGSSCRRSSQGLPDFSSSSSSSWQPFGGGGSDSDAFLAEHLSQFLLKGCHWREAPKCPDYVGPVAVKLTPDGRGRGLFASQNLQAGSLLLISNALAVSHNDPHRIQLLAKLVSLAQASPKFRHQLYTMAACSSQNDMMVPPMTLFTSAGGDSFASRPEDGPFDQKKIMDIVMLNAFEGELSSWPDPDPAPKFSGIWWLPSFINHSCFRNASRLIVGEAMVVLAASDIQAEEEITISYVDVLAPLKMREEACQAMGFGFCCNCKRCVVERSLENSLREESERFHSLYGKAVEEVQSAVFAREPLPLDASSACLELSEVFASLNSKVTSFANLTKLEKQWIIAGYSSAFLGKWLVSGYSTGFAKGSAFVNPTALELIEAMKSAVPGMLRTLSFTMLLVFLAQRTKASQALATRLLRLGMDECMRVYGKQKQDVMLQLMAQSSEVVPFF